HGHRGRLKRDRRAADREGRGRNRARRRSRRSAQGRDMDAPGRSPWAVLGIPEDATLADARRAFRRLVKQAHPDTGRDGRTLAAVVAAFDELRHLLPPPPSVPRSPRHLRRPTPYDAFLSPPARSRTWAETPTF